MSSFDITLDDAQVRAALARLAQRLADPAPAMQEIGDLLLASTRERFKRSWIRQQDAPSCRPSARIPTRTRAVIALGLSRARERSTHACCCPTASRKSGMWMPFSTTSVRRAKNPCCSRT